MSNIPGKNFFHSTVSGKAIVPGTAVAASAVNGATISEPWHVGRQITFILISGAFAASSTATCVVQGLLRSDGVTWEAIKEGPHTAGTGPTGSTDLQFTAAKLADAGELEATGVLVGTLDLNRIQAETYKAIRLVYTSAVDDQVVGAAYVISDLVREPSGTTDDLWSKQVYGSA